MFDLTLSNGRRLHFATPQVMGIINVTPDSFFAGSRVLQASAGGGMFTPEAAALLRERVVTMVRQGAGMIDVGACSTRPRSEAAAEDEELARLEWALPIVVEAVRSAECEQKEASQQKAGAQDACGQSYIPVSVDTFRARVAEASVSRLGADIVNDVSGGAYDEGMLPLVARLRVPYIMMHIYPTDRMPGSGEAQPITYPEGVYAGVIGFLKQQLGRLAELAGGLDRLQGKVVLDPGFGFAKDVDENYRLFAQLRRFKADCPECPLLVGISRKSMIFKLLGTDAAHALNGTTVLNTLALQAGADILRVHDVPEAVEAVRICTKVFESKV